VGMELFSFCEGASGRNSDLHWVAVVMRRHLVFERA
jgi:hypothetical protein